MAKLKTSGMVKGRLVCHPDGYGFVIAEDPILEEDVFIPPKKMGDAVDGDTVRVRLIPSQQRRRKGKGSLEGEVEKVLSRGRETLVGRLFHQRQDIYVAPLDSRYYYTVRLVDEEAKKIEEGMIVSVTITAQPGRNQTPLGKVKEVLGDPDDPEVQYKIVCHQHGIPMEFPASVLREAAKASEPDKSEMDSRVDFRTLPTVTIDGDSARDFDDAVSIEKQENGHFKLWVHIADVSHYVRPDSALDREALNRGTSVYFPDRAIPMLPEKLSNQLCSLNPGVDRLTMSVVMEIDGQGDVQRSDFCRSVIHSDERMTYTAVRQILIDRDARLRKRYKDLLENFDWMLELSRILTARRLQRGAIDFDLPEAEIEYDAHGEIHDVVRAERSEAHRLIEEFMLLANETVAQHLNKHRIPLIYRVHEEPDASRLEEFQETAVGFGYSLKRNSKGKYPSKSFQQLMLQVADKPEARFLPYLMLRSFKQAQYSELKQGHFGLASPCYTHFTSPIRRYPDLVIHSLLKMALERTTSGVKADKFYSRLQEMAVQSSQRERGAVEAAREIMRWLMAQFMGERLGEEYQAFVIGVRRNGFFVELLEHFVEGFVPVETMLDDYYVFNQRHHSLIGERRRKVYRIGDQLKVQVVKVRPHRHLIEFSPVMKTRQRKRKRKR
jgi:ribonuclease R